MLLAATRHAVIDFKRFWSGQSAQALPDLREAGLVRILCGISSLNLWPNVFWLSVPAYFLF
jgi:hypothetical protein